MKKTKEFSGNSFNNGLGTTCGFWTSKRTKSDKTILEQMKKEKENNK